MNLTGRRVGVMVAGLDPVKGHDTLLRALALGAPPELLVLIVGDGALGPVLPGMAAELGLGDDHVRFLGRRNDVDRLLDAADFFVLPSRQEGFPIAVLEAMAHGVPVIATPVGGVPELITHGRDGLLVAPDRPRKLNAAILRLTREASLRASLGQAGRLRVKTDFSFALMTRRYEALYLRLKSQRTPKAGT